MIIIFLLLLYVPISRVLVSRAMSAEAKRFDIIGIHYIIVISYIDLFTALSLVQHL